MKIFAVVYSIAAFLILLYVAGIVSSDPFNLHRYPVLFFIPAIVIALTPAVCVVLMLKLKKEVEAESYYLGRKIFELEDKIKNLQLSAGDPQSPTEKKKEEPK